MGELTTQINLFLLRRPPRSFSARFEQEEPAIPALKGSTFSLDVLRHDLKENFCDSRSLDIGRPKVQKCRRQ